MKNKTDWIKHKESRIDEIKYRSMNDKEIINKTLIKFKENRKEVYGYLQKEIDGYKQMIMELEERLEVIDKLLKSTK